MSKDSILLYLEYIAVITGVLSVWFSRKNNIWVYPIGIVSVGIYAILLFYNKIYAFAAINIYYLIVSIVGWHNWLKKTDSQYEFPIQFSDRKEWFYGLAIFLVSSIIMYLLLTHFFKDSMYPILDTLTSAIAACAMWWMARRKVESWFGWILSNLLAIPLFIYQQMWPSTVQYIILLILAIWGYFTWSTIAKKNITT